MISTAQSYHEFDTTSVLYRSCYVYFVRGRWSRQRNLIARVQFQYCTVACTCILYQVTRKILRQKLKHDWKSFFNFFFLSNRGFKFILWRMGIFKALYSTVGFKILFLKLSIFPTNYLNIYYNITYNIYLFIKNITVYAEYK